jgi:hypothetical protein
MYPPDFAEASATNGAMPRRLSATAATVLMLTLTPAPALAQSAGDDQYQDPLAAPSEPQQSDEQDSAPATSAPAPSSTPAPAAESADSTPAAAAPAAELPRTGLPAGLIGLAGMALTGAGVALRRRT